MLYLKDSKALKIHVLYEFFFTLCNEKFLKYPCDIYIEVGGVDYTHVTCHHAFMWVHQWGNEQFKFLPPEGLMVQVSVAKWRSSKAIIMPNDILYP